MGFFGILNPQYQSRGLGMGIFILLFSTIGMRISAPEFLCQGNFLYLGLFTGDRGYSQIFEFLSRELGFLIQLIGNILKSGDFYFGDSEFFLNLEIFIPGIIPGFLLLRLGIFENLGIFIPEIDHFLYLGIFIPGIEDFFKSGDFYLRR